MASRRSAQWRAWRIGDPRFPIFDGGGAARYGARWNSPGRFVIYASETYAGALVECLVHANIGAIPKSHVFVEITVPGSVSVERLRPEKTPGWDADDYQTSRAFGDRWYDEGRSCILAVPSVVTRVEWNVVINQRHPHFAKLRVSAQTPVYWDRRLMR